MRKNETLSFALIVKLVAVFSSNKIDWKSENQNKTKIESKNNKLIGKKIEQRWMDGLAYFLCFESAFFLNLIDFLR